MQRFDEVRVENVSSPRMVLLRGVSGAGKSRVIREFYRMLLIHRRDLYWPHIPESGGGDEPSRDPLPGRKTIGPAADTFLWRPETLPTFGWWQFHCERMRNGDVIDVVAQARVELEAHLIPMALAWSRAATLKQKVQKRSGNVVEAARDALQEGGLEAAAMVLEKFDIAIPGLGTGFSWLMKGFRSIGQARAKRQMHSSEVAIGDIAMMNRRSVAHELADVIKDLSIVALPSVVVIEDLHLMDQGMATLLDEIGSARPGHPIMVVGTAWPESDKNGAYGAWRQAAVAQRCLEVVDMPNLTSAELVSLVRGFAPETQDEVATEIVSRLANPLVLEAALSSKRVQRAIRSNGGAVPVEVIEAVPASVEGVYRDRFGELDKVSQTGLALCAIALPDHKGAAWPFVREVISHAATACDVVEEAGTAAVAALEADGAWLISQGKVEFFREALQADVAAEHARAELFLPAEIRSYREAVAISLDAAIDFRRGGSCWLPGDDESVGLARWYAELARERVEPARYAASLLIAQTHAEAHEYEQAVALVGPEPSNDVKDAFERLIVRGNLATWLIESGQTKEALSQFGKLLIEHTELVGQNNPATVLSRVNVSLAMRRLGRNAAEALDLLAVPMCPEQRWLGPPTAERYFRGNLASWLAHWDRVQDGVQQIEEMLAQQMRSANRDPRFLIVRSNLASWIGRARGQFDAPAEYLEALLADHYQIFGSTHSFSLTCRSNIATWVGESGRASEAADRLERVLSDSICVLPPDSPTLFTIWNNLATWLAEARRLDDAADELVSLLKVVERDGAQQDAYALAVRRSLDYVNDIRSRPTSMRMCGTCKGTGGGSYLTRWANCHECGGTGLVDDPRPRRQYWPIFA